MKRILTIALTALVLLGLAGVARAGEDWQPVIFGTFSSSVLVTNQTAGRVTLEAVVLESVATNTLTVTADLVVNSAANTNRLWAAESITLGVSSTGGNDLDLCWQHYEVLYLTSSITNTCRYTIMTRDERQ